jgi:signal transduction histidine kinase
MIIISEIIITAIASLAFGLLLVLSALRFRSRELIVFHLALYIVLGLLLSITHLMIALSFMPLDIGLSYQQIAGITLLAMILALGALTLNFLKKQRGGLITYWVVALIVFTLWALTAFNSSWTTWENVIANLDLSQDLAANYSLNLIGSPAQMIAGLGWCMSIAIALIGLGLDLRKRQLTQYRNRLWYWLIATALLSLSGSTWFINPLLFSSVGLGLLLIGSILVGYTVLSYQAPDLRLLLLRAMRHSGVTAILTSVFFAGLAAAITINRRYESDPTNVLVWSVIIAVILANFFPIVARFSHRLITVLLFRRQQYDDKRVIQHYSQRISTALDMKRLSDVVINLMIETLGLEQGIVFISERSATGEITLRPLSSVGVSEVTSGHLALESPIIDYLRQGKKSLSQYDIDVLPEFRKLSDQERQWFSSLGMELFIPIMRQHELEGLLAFGPQPAGTAYYDEDLDLMTALADQTALAMDSARLFEQLRIVNDEVGGLTEQLAHLDGTKSDFLSIASHELRTPLTHIHGYSRMLLDLTEEELKDPSYVKTLIEGVVKGSERMTDVLDLMFDVTEANVGEMRLFTGPVNLEEVIEQASRSFLPAMDERRIAFGYDCRNLPVVEADGTRLVQAMENLISNAIKYTPDGGTIKIEGRPTVLDNVGSAVEIIVSDTGIGIDPEEHERIFEKFYRIGDTMHHSTGKTKFKGAGPGLGLTLIKGIAEAHGGTVLVESLGYDEVNCPGSKFYFIIPLHPIKTDDQAAQVTEQANIETRHWRRSDLMAKKN